MGVETAKKKRRKQAVKGGRESGPRKGLGRTQNFTLASCMDCSALVAWCPYGDEAPIDIPFHWREDVLAIVGAETVLRQGIGNRNGGNHRCPWTLGVEVIS